MRSSLRHSITASLLAAMWVVVPLLAMVHIAVEEHNYCAEHGTLEEGSGHHRNAKILANESSEAPADALQGASPQGPNEEAHTDCALGDQATHDTTPLEIAIAVQAAPSVAPLPIRATDAAIPSPFDILLGAPKTSPPQLA